MTGEEDESEDEGLDDDGVEGRDEGEERLDVRL